MNFGNFGFTEILLLLVLVLLLFGAKRLPEIGASMGKGIREFKRSLTDTQRALTEPERETRSERLQGGETDRAMERPRRDDEEKEPRRLLS